MTMAHFLGDFIHFDTQIFRTIIPLIFKPGFLVNEYMRGRRADYLSPIRMYVFLSLVFFYVFYLSNKNEETFNGIHINSTVPVSIDSLSNMSEDDIAGWKDSMPIKKSDAFLDWNGLAFNTTSDYQEFIDTLSSKDRPPEWLNKIVLKLLSVNERIDSKQSFSELLSENFLHNLPKMVFLLLPFLALWLKILYIRTGARYMQHLILMIQSYNLLFLMATIIMLIEMIPGVGDIMVWLLWILVIHFTLSLRFVFDQSWIKTTLKSFAFFWGMIFLLAFGAVVNTFYSIFSM
jgi:Protein of unknown function (DUF3667)